MSDHDEENEACRYVIYKAFPKAERLVILKDNVTKAEATAACLAFMQRTALSRLSVKERSRDVYELRYTSMRTWRMAYGAQRAVQARRLT